MNNPKIAVILAGGKGTRLKPLTDTIPKPLIEVHGKPVVEHLLDLLKKYGVEEVCFCVGHLKEKVIGYFGDGRQSGLKIKYIEEDNPLGTAGPLRKARKFLKESFIVSNADELKNIEIDKMFDLHKKSGAWCTVALTRADDPSQYGVAVLKDDKILRFIEKPKKGGAPSNLINSGFYIMEPEVLDIIPEGFSMLEKDVFPKLAAEGKLAGFPFSGQWFDTGTFERLEKARREWKDV